MSAAPPGAPADTAPADAALAALLDWLKGEGYRFITPTPLTHSRIWERRCGGLAGSLRDVFGWSLPFAPGLLPAKVLEWMRAAGVLNAGEAPWRSAVRVSSLGTDLFAHSAYPTDAADAVFFGPDTYRFASFITGQLAGVAGPATARVVDVGCGSGAGAVVAARCWPGAALVMNDINPLALRYAALNAQVAGLGCTLAEGDALSAVQGRFDLVLSNPPYLVDDAVRAYRHGGERLGRALSVRIAAQALDRLAPGGRLLLYTGVAMVQGSDPFLQEMQSLLQAAGCTHEYREIDPDVFGEELDRPAYHGVDRIAAVGLAALKPAA